MTSSDATIDLGGWLLSLGLGRYEAAFRENEIDTDVLSDLTELDLEKLGLPLGPARLGTFGQATAGI
jgi:SAM domain (Sterile alpha motif)